MKINQIYLEASFISFVIHASIILYLLGFFYYESQQTSVLSKPIEVNLIFEEKIEAKKQVNQKLEPKEIINDNSISENSPYSLIERPIYLSNWQKLKTPCFPLTSPIYFTKLFIKIYT